jgi:hypothetical protein
MKRLLLLLLWIPFSVVLEARTLSPDQGWQDLSVKLISLVHNNCYDRQNGRIEVLIFGGHKPYTVSWKKDGQPFAETQDLENLAAGTYEIHVQDSRGKSLTKTYTITAPKELRFSDSLRRPACASGVKTGTITIKPQGGTPPYHYEVFKDGHKILSQTANRFPNMEFGRYDITVVDALGCRSARAVVMGCQ